MNCSITNCEKAEKVRGYCKHHYRKEYLLKIHPLWVVYNEKFKRYRTRISYNSKTIYGGSFKTLEEAKECRIKLEKMYPAK